MSGVGVAPECTTEWNNMKIKHMYNYITFMIKEHKEIVIDQKGKSSYPVFKSKLAADQCRYAVVEVPGTTKIVFLLWAPDSANVKDKMIYAASRQALIEKLSGHTRAIQASDLSDVDENKIKASL
eukprot:Protomagalhaensia_wolfi_Nauph_80__1031@NODE_1599_length_1449_cov_966_407092_g1161_i1_p2_GENE_NODE_1599_length_1449_cov_966_407092_g1161_i1NODE_1599_length_1449_cov_966_407092_g1161_i1_p2_ORF_typecomplete_len125_score22_46Cofilin_ADF/PF00241_20/4_7e27Neuralized/PF07177_12/0_054Pox_L3_FP4/PF03339_14/0_088_NODE_1599_length_1449_cov_966_407092_g1161_i18561230